jgi:hypothetical protein
VQPRTNSALQLVAIVSLFNAGTFVTARAQESDLAANAPVVHRCVIDSAAARREGNLTVC